MTAPKETQAQRRESVRAQAQALRAKQAAAERRVRCITAAVLGVTIVGLVVAVVVLMVGAGRDRVTVTDMPLSQVEAVPATATSTGGIPVDATGGAGGERSEGAVDVNLYFDYMCPYCGNFGTTNDAMLLAMSALGKVNITLQPLAFLDGMSQGSEYSTRAASALAWVADRAPEYTLAFHNELFASQPQEGTPGHDNFALGAIAGHVGVAEPVAAGIADGTAHKTYAQWVHSATLAAQDSPALVNPATGRFGTPAVTLNGEMWLGDWTDVNSLQAEIASRVPEGE